MANKYSKFRKSLIASLCAVSLACTGLAAACSQGSGDGDTDKDEGEPFVKREDTQTLKNGNFELYDYPSAKQLEDGKASYLIKTPDSWSRAGDTSGTMGGIIGTSPEEWAALTDDGLAQALKDNADRSSSDDDYINYNGMRARDVLYKDTYAALLEQSNLANSYIKNQTFADYFGITREGSSPDFTYKMGNRTVYISDSVTDADKSDDNAWKNYEFFFDAEFTEPVREEIISNPGTHYNITGENGNYHFTDGNKTVNLKKDEATGSLYYTAEGDDPEDIFVSNVLMLHNYDNDITSSGTTNSSKYNGIHQYYTSQSITLEANTAAEISVWVKTSDLKFDKGYSQNEDQDRGAYIEVLQTVGGKSVDSVKIESINTEKIIADIGDDDSYGSVIQNGWIKYTVYVNACDFASSTVQLRLGLGDSDNYKKLAGYAFFDDVQVTKYLSLDDEGCTYPDHESEVLTSNLTSEADDKIYIADKNLNENDERNEKNFYYHSDLSSVTGENVYAPIPFDGTKVSLTEYKDGGKYYVSSIGTEAKLEGVELKASENEVTLPRNTDSRVTVNDILGVYSYDKEFKKADFADAQYSDFRDYSELLNKNLTKEDARLPGYDGKILLTLSSRGAAYTSALTNGAFSLLKDEYMLVSLWVKTSDLAATVKLTSLDDPDKTSSISVNSTGITTDIGENEDVYHGWAQCFLFLQNDTEDTQSFKIELLFGNTTINSSTTYTGGYAAMCNVQALKIDKEVYALAPSGSTVMTYAFSEEKKDETGVEFDAASGTSDIKNGLANLANYNGFNGAGSYVSDNDYVPSYDAKNTNKNAGLINRKYYEDYSDELKELISGAFTSAASATAKWDDVFGETCYQPAIIINSLREYTEEASATEDTYSLYYVEADDGYSGEDLLTIDGKKYKKATEWDEDATYYNFAVNYGFVGSSASVAANSCVTLSVRVKVAGDAQAWIYLVDQNREVLKYTASEYTFHYDKEGNVLDEKFDADWVEGSAKHRSHIVYSIREEDGLYDGKDGGIYFNLNNLIKKYDNYLFNADKGTYQFYDAPGGNRVALDDLKDGETYYDQNGNKAPHYLANSDGKRIFEWKDNNYYYIDGEGKTTDTVVKNFSDDYKRSYSSIDKEYAVCVTDTKGEWVTVNFIINNGNVAKNYRMELWSGERGSNGIAADGTYKTGAVAFDRCSYSVTSSNFATLLGEYEDDLINEYKALLISDNKLSEVEFDNENLSYYEKLLDKLAEDETSTITKNAVNAIKDKYTAYYHAYSFYDSPVYAPRSAEELARFEYDATADTYAESMAYFTYNNYSGEKLTAVNTFADYSVIEKLISENVTGDDTDEGDDGETPAEDDNKNSANVWLYAASILLLVAMLITLLSIIARKLYKYLLPKFGSKKRKQNNYKKRERYMRKLHLVKEEPIEDEEPDQAAAPEEEPVKEESSEPVEEAPAEPAEAPAEEPAEEVKPEEAVSDESSDGDNKD